MESEHSNKDILNTVENLLAMIDSDSPSASHVGVVIRRQFSTLTIYVKFPFDFRNCKDLRMKAL
jgi:hypothetical protein